MKNSSNSKPEGELTLDERMLIAKAVDEYGPRPISELLGISRLALANSLAPPMHSARGTIAIIRSNLHKLKDK